MAEQVIHLKSVKSDWCRSAALFIGHHRTLFKLRLNNRETDAVWGQTLSDSNFTLISKSSLKAFMRHCIKTKFDTWWMSELYNEFIFPLRQDKLATWKKKSHLHIMFKTSKHKSQSLFFFPMVAKYHITDWIKKAILYIRVCTSSCVIHPL